jgi:hypothetical protein
MRKWIFLLALLGVTVGLWPQASSLADLTGEAALVGQVRGVLQWGLTAIRPNLALAPDAAFTHADVPIFGMNAFLEQEPSPDVRAETARRIRAMGFHFIRQQFSWEDIEIHAKGDFEDRRNVEAIGIVSAWDKYDHIVAVAAENGLDVIARLDNPPAWSRAVGNGENDLDAHGPPDDFADYGDFVAAVVGRYRGQITYFQLWNEPNIYPEWGSQPPDPETFVELACLGYQRAKAANPDAVILAAALAPTVAFDNRNMNDIIFLQRAYAAGYGACFDVFSAQGYGFWSGPADQRLRPTVINYPHHLLLRDVMVRNGDADKAIWISEVGWNAVPDGPIPQVFGQVTLAQQADYAVQLYERAQTEWPWIGAVNYWFFKRPADREKEQPFYYFRVMEPDFTPLPVYDALSDYANGLQPEADSKMRGAWQRPLLFAAGALCFFTLVQLLLPDDDD